MFSEINGPFLYSSASITLSAPKLKGIYYCCGDDQSKPFYVGTTINENATIHSQLLDNFQHKNWFDVVYFFYKTSSSIKEIEQEEIREIEKYKPKYNMQSNGKTAAKKLSAISLGKQQELLDFRLVPIFDKQEKIFAYELFVDERKFAKNNYEDTRSINDFIESLAQLEIGKIASGKPVGYRFDNKVILVGAVSKIPHKIKVVINETFPVNESSVKICQGLKKAGYGILLADIQQHRALMPLENLAETIYFDFNKYRDKVDNLKTLLKRLKSSQCKSLATNVNSFVDYSCLRKLGVDYFNGNFYLEQLPIAWLKLKRINLLSDLWREENTLDEITNIFQQEPNLLENMLLLANAEIFKATKKINTLQGIMNTLGKKELPRLVTIVSLAEMTSGRPHKIFSASMMRGRTAELIAQELHLDVLHSEMLFIMAAFTLLDVFLDVPMDYVFNNLSISFKIQEMMQKNTFNEVLEIVIACEKGEWKTVDFFCAKLKLDKKLLSQIYRDATAWTGALETLFESNGVL